MFFGFRVSPKGNKNKCKRRKDRKNKETNDAKDTFAIREVEDKRYFEIMTVRISKQGQQDLTRVPGS